MKIERISIKNFRGLTDTTNIHFKKLPTDPPSSMLIMGGNGTGKSSIVDAIQFVLQGQFEKGKSLKDSLSLFKTENAEVEIELSNQAIIKKYICRPEDSSKNPKIKTESEGIKNFQIAPFVLRRSDLLNFINTPDTKRQLVFSNYHFKDTQSTSEKKVITESKIQELETKRIELKQKRRKLRDHLAKNININSELIPIGLADFDKFVMYNLRNGVSSSQSNQQIKPGSRGFIPRHIHKLVKDIREVSVLIQKIEKESKEIQKTLVKNIKNSSLIQILQNASLRLTKSFQKISNSDYVQYIKLDVGIQTDISLSISVYLNNGRVCYPHTIFSEANLDLLILLIFLSLIQEAASQGQAKVLVLDDVFQGSNKDVVIKINNS